MNLNRCARQEAANILVKIHEVIPLNRVKTFFYFFTVLIELEGSTIFGLLDRLHVLRQIKRNSAKHDRDQRLGIDADTLCIEFEINSAGIPETGILADLFVIGRIDEHSDIHRFCTFVEIVIDNLADFDSTIINWRTDIERTKMLRLKNEISTRHS